MRAETTLFFDSILREDRSLLDLIDARYTFLNERVAKHYGIPGVYGSRFRKVTVPDHNQRGGLLAHGSLLVTTSYPDRTSPVLRGKWLLNNIFGTPPPAPPPGVNATLETKPGTLPTSMRERLAQRVVRGINSQQRLLTHGHVIGVGGDHAELTSPDPSRPRRHPSTASRAMASTASRAVSSLVQTIDSVTSAPAGTPL